MHPVSIFHLSFLTLGILALPYENLSLTNYTVEYLGIVTDPTNNEGIIHDGGGGASQNGYHVQIFADSATSSEGFNFVHNSVAYYGYRDPTDPLALYTFGMKGDIGKSVFTDTPLGPVDNETALGSNFAIWMLSGMTPMPDGKTILGVFPALNEGVNPVEDLYSTMVQMEVVDPTTVAPGGFPPFKRLGTGRLFYPNEVNYGKFAVMAASDGYLYLAGSDVTGVKLARTPNAPASLADRNEYKYWNSLSQAWQSVPLDKNNAVGNLLTWSSMDLAGGQIGPDAGDMWYDPYHETTVMMWGDSGIDGTFWFSYALDSNNIEGEWSDPVAIWTPPVPDECDGSPTSWNYCGHSHPGWDPSGKTLLISYSSCVDYVSFARITW